MPTRRRTAPLIALPLVVIAPFALGAPATGGAGTVDATWTPLVAYFLGAMVVSFVCSLLEATLLSIGPATVEMLASQGKRSGTILRDLKKRVDRPLIAILTTNTIANMLGAAGVGAEAQTLAEAKGWEPGVVVLVAATVLTVAILVFSEIVPKTLGAAHSRALAPPASYLLLGLVRLLWPVVIALEGVPKAIAGSDGPAGPRPAALDLRSRP
ncbi:MAG: DUF21 domain-containing protein [Planctomycetota bacterium]